MHRYASKTLKRKRGFYFKKSYHRQCSSLLDVSHSGCNQLPTPKSPESEDSTDFLLFNDFAAYTSFVVESPNYDVLPDDECRLLHTSSTISTVNEGTPVLLNKERELEPFPVLMEKPLVTFQPKLRITTADRWHLRELERLYYSKNVWKYHRLRSVGFDWKRLRARIRDYVKSTRQTQEVVFPTKRIKAVHVDCFWLLENSSEDESITGTPIIMPKVRTKSKKQESRNSGKELNVSLERYDILDLIQDMPSLSTKPLLNVKANVLLPLTYQTLASWNLVRPNSNTWSESSYILDKSFPDAVSGLVLEDRYGKLIRDILEGKSKEVKLESEDKLISKKAYLDLGNAIELGRKASKVVKDMQDSFQKQIPFGISSAIYDQHLGVEVSSLKHYWSWILPGSESSANLKTNVRLGTLGHIQVHNSMEGQAGTKTEEDPQKSRQSSLSTLNEAFPHPKRLTWADKLCSVADELLQTAQEILEDKGEDHDEEEEENDSTSDLIEL